MTEYPPSVKSASLHRDSFDRFRRPLHDFSSERFQKIAAEDAASNRRIGRPQRSGHDLTAIQRDISVQNMARSRNRGFSLPAKALSEALASGRIADLSLYMRLRQAGIEPGQTFTVQDVGLRAREAERIARFCSRSPGPRGQIRFRLPVSYDWTAITRGERTARINLGHGDIVAPPSSLTSDKAFRCWSFSIFVQRAPGKYFASRLAAMFDRCKSTIRNYARELGLTVTANFIEIAVSCDQDWRRIKATGEDWYLVIARLGESVSVKLLRSASIGWFKHWHRSGYSITVAIRTANSYHPPPD